MDSTGRSDTDPIDTDPIDTDPFIDPDARDRVVVRGPDAMTYLHSQISQDIRGLPVGSAAWTLVLQPAGKVEALARVTRTSEDEFVMDTDAGFGEALQERLRRFKIRVDADLELEEAVNAEPAPSIEDARIAAGWPRTGHEIVPGETIPAVTGVVGFAVNFTKGCYPGQELVERMDSRGADAPWSLRIVSLGREVPRDAAVGDPILSDDGSPVGTVTSVGSTRALVVVKRAAAIGTAPAHLR